MKFEAYKRTKAYWSIRETESGKTVFHLNWHPVSFRAKREALRFCEYLASCNGVVKTGFKASKES